MSGFTDGLRNSDDLMNFNERTGGALLPYDGINLLAPEFGI